MKQYGIIGFPLSHSLSPKLHNQGFQAHSISAQYKAWSIKPNEIKQFMHKFRQEHIHGLSVTLPHKKAIMPFVDKLTQRAKKAGAVNTLFWDNEYIIGDNTDIQGIVEPIRQQKQDINSALILGAGGAARAAIIACQELKIQKIYISNRTEEKSKLLAQEFHIQSIDWNKKEDIKKNIKENKRENKDKNTQEKSHFDLIINATPLGMYGEMENKSPWNGKLNPKCIVFDLVYNPLETQFIKQAQKSGCQSIQGLEMFIHQGLEQFKLWTGIELNAVEAREVVLGCMG